MVGVRCRIGLGLWVFNFDEEVKIGCWGGLGEERKVKRTAV